ncbi:MAG: hypothetical protein JSV19_01950 [Phycisphaerales bacterium]|nr:MAG: hypothetical protein JSV19_01950 [Phycisphaerales bacterium]
MMTRLLHLTAVGVVATLVWPVPAWAQYPSEVVGFNGPPIDDPATCQEMFRTPQFSGTTSRYVLANVVGYDNNAAFRASGLLTEGAAALRAFFKWVDPSDPEGWLRLTTFNGAERPNPALDTRGKVRFKIVNQGPIPPTGEGTVGLCIGIRETGVDVAQLADGGSSGPIEWVGVSTDLSVIDAGTNGIIESTVAGDDVLIDTNGVQAINWGPDRILQSVANPTSDDVADYGYVFSSATGSRLPIPAITIPVSVVPKLVEWNLTTGQVSVDGAPGVGGTAGFTGNGDLTDAPNNRGTFEHLAITNVVADLESHIEFAIDELQFEATVPDQPPPPRIRGPVYNTDTVVEVECDVGLPYNVTLAELFIGDQSQGTEAPVSGVATFSGLSLGVGNVLTATQTGNGVESPPSVPVVVYGEGTVLADDFEGYTDQADMETIWGQTDPAAGELFRPRLITGSASSCENMVINDYPYNVAGSRLYRSIGEVNGNDLEPLWVTFRFKHDYNSTSARTRFELTPATDPAVRTYGAIGFAFTNGVGDEWGEQYTSMTNSPDPVLTGYVSDYFNYDYALTGIEREPGVWHKMQMKIDSNYVNFYIDDQLANPVGTNGLPLSTNGIPVYPNGVTRVNNDPFRYVVLSIGYWSGGPIEMYDDISVTIADTPVPFGDPNPVEAPTVFGPVLPTGTLVDLVDIDSNATQVAVFANGVRPAVGTATGPFLDNTATVSVSPRVNGDVITATQTVGGTESCFSWPEVVGVPAVTVQDFLVVGQTAVDVSDLAEGLADAVTVYRMVDGEPVAILGTVTDPATDPVTVDVTPLVEGHEIAATQTVAGVEGPPSASVTVRSTSVMVEYEMQTTLAGLSLSIAADDMINGQIGILENLNSNGNIDPENGVVAWVLSAPNCLMPLEDTPSPGFHGATPGGAAGGLADLTDGIEGSTVEAVLGDFARAALVVRYDFASPTDVEEIVVFAANEDPNAPYNGRLFQHYDVYVSRDYAQTFEPLALTVTTGGFGYLNQAPVDLRATYTRVYDALSLVVAEGVTDVRLVFFDVSNTGGRFHDPWGGNANEDAGYQANCPDVEPEDTDGYRPAFEAPIVKEIDIFGVRQGDGDRDGDVDLADFVILAACMTGPDNGPVGVGCEMFDFSPKDNDVDLADFAGFQEAFD